MKNIKNILITICLTFITTQVFAMGAKLPSATTTQQSTSVVIPPANVTSTKIFPNFVNLFSTLMSLLPGTLGPLPGLLSLLPTIISNLPKKTVPSLLPSSIMSSVGTSLTPKITIPAVNLNTSTNVNKNSTNSGAYIDQIQTLAADSTCANYAWKNRGKAPVGYIEGVSLSFARSLCRLKNNTSTAIVMSAKNSGNDSKDSLTHYQSIFQSLPISIEVAGAEPLRAVYTLGMGLGMRESSGSYCEGWDKAAGSSRSSSAAEAGVFQTSYDSIGSSPELSKLYAEYKANPESCFLNTFKQGVSCGQTSILGSGAGADYQAFNKSCPAFATEYAMIMLRVQRGHYGPINRKEAEVLPACNQLLKSVQDLIDSDPYACQDIL